MKKKIFAFLTGLSFVLTAQNAVAGSAEQCMADLPHTVSFVHIQDPMRKIGGMVNYEHQYPGKGLGYSQFYQNELCAVSVFLYNLNLPRISAQDVANQQTISERDMATSTAGDTNFIHQVYITSFGNYFLKLRTTCGILYSGDEYKYNDMLATTVSSTVEESIVRSLSNCMR